MQLKTSWRLAARRALTEFVAQNRLGPIRASTRTNTLSNIRANPKGAID